MVRTSTVLAIGHAQCQHAHPADIYVHGNRRLSTREQTAPPKIFPIAADDELDAALASRAVVHADLREEAACLASKIHAQQACSVRADPANEVLSTDADRFASDSKVGLGNAPTTRHPSEIERR